MQHPAVKHVYFYRYEDRRYASMLNEYDEPMGRGRMQIDLRKFRVVKETPCGVRLDIGRFVNTSSRKKFACATEDEAMESFKARKRRQASIYAARLADAEEALRIAEGRFFL